jgi:putative DNA-invertase from lambdoid prophage Rac
MKAGIYARVSTHDQHTLGMQIEAMKKYANALDWHRSNKLFSCTDSSM